MISLSSTKACIVEAIESQNSMMRSRPTLGLHRCGRVVTLVRSSRRPHAAPSLDITSKHILTALLAWTRPDSTGAASRPAALGAAQQRSRGLQTRDRSSASRASSRPTSASKPLWVMVVQVPHRLQHGWSRSGPPDHDQWPTRSRRPRLAGSHPTSAHTAS